ncbi:MAG: hypothetical protein LC104_15055 [Bacteroidales bacterium]|nr:hypothetical protein [Bacteroidales bacterium]
MRPGIDPSEMTADERRREVVTILADGLCRLRDRSALAASPHSENPSEASEKSLEDVRRNPVTEVVG